MEIVHEVSENLSSKISLTILHCYYCPQNMLFHDFLYFRILDQLHDQTDLQFFNI